MTAQRETEPTESELLVDARALLRRCVPSVPDDVIERQARKIVKGILPTVRAAWAQPNDLSIMRLDAMTEAQHRACGCADCVRWLREHRR